MALTQSTVDLVADRTAGRVVTRVRLEVGALSGVVPEAVRFCFDLASRGTNLEGAELDIAETPGRLSCRECGTTSDCTDLVRLCPCGSADVEVVSGQELLVTSVDVRKEQACA